MGEPLSSLPISRAAETSTFVLVHGAWHGGWCWKYAAERLRAIGHSVFTPTLTGLGERAHLLRPDIDLTTHIDDVLGVLEYEDLNNVVLVGHSYGGMVIAGVAERAPSRVARLVYLDAFFPEDGMALRDYLPGEELDEMVTSLGDGWRLPSPWTAKDFGITDEEDADWVNARLGDHPYKTFTQPLNLGANVHNSIQGAYIRTTEGRYISHAARARESGYDSYELFSAGHNSMMTRPAELAALLLTIAENRPHLESG